MFIQPGFGRMVGEATVPVLCHFCFSDGGGDDKTCRGFISLEILNFNLFSFFVELTSLPFNILLFYDDA
jgi:hypothetical protein